MKVLRIHNAYREAGGEDQVEAQETALLRAAGHQVVEYRRSSREIGDYGPVRRAGLPLELCFGRRACRELRALVARERPQVAHFTNTFPLISAAAYGAVRNAGVPVVQTLHNYRLLCPAATLLRKGSVCEECIERGLGRSIRHACYRDSRAQTAALAGSLALHRLRGSYARDVDLYVALTEHARRVFARGGLPAERMVVAPNTVTPDPGPRAGPGEILLFAGRLAPEKGVLTLLQAYERVCCAVPSPPPLWLAGDGPLRDEAERLAADRELPVRFTGLLTREALLKLMARARALVVPSEWYEGFPVVVAEAFARGVPVVASRLGGLAELVEDGRTGRLFAPGDAGALAEALLASARDPASAIAQGRAARRVYEAQLAPEHQLARLLTAYRKAREHFEAQPPARR